MEIIENVNSISNTDRNRKFGLATADIDTEHQLTLGHVWKHHKAIIGWSFFWAMCAVGWGFDGQVNGAMIGVAAFREDFGYILDGQAVLPARWQTAFNVISGVGQFLGGFCCSWVADRAGRKPSLAAGILICTAGIVGEVATTSNTGFLMSKLLLGFGLGFYLTLGPLMCSEITPVVFRGISTAGVNLGIAIGQLISNSVIKGFGERTDRWAYRGPFAIQFLFALFLAIGLPFSPESPWYLVRAGKPEQARKSLERLFGKDADTDISAKLADIEITVREESTKVVPSFLECFRGTNLLRTGISTGVFACQHFVGIIFVLGYSTYFFQLAGLDASYSFDLGVGVTACGVLGNFCSWFLVNSFGRRKVFNLGMITLTALLLLIGIMDVVPSTAAKWVQASATVLYAFIYFLTIGAMAFVLLGETSSIQLKARTTALTTAVQALSAIVMSFAIPYMVNPDEGNLRGKVGFVFGGLGAIATLASFFYIPELKGRTFGEIDTMFLNRVPPRKMGSYHIEVML
ncbi:general substrate transporter [Stipitochalara longipes BDJ]|nr:general substrate transporter [Stipitochalara longipes BDJ]